MAPSELNLGGEAPVFSYVDLIRAEIALEVADQFGVEIPNEEADGWRTLGDVARSVVQRAGETTSESAVFDWVRGLIADGYGIATTLTPDEEIFGDCDRMTAWFMAAPYPHCLGDRWFARTQGRRDGELTE